MISTCTANSNLSSSTIGYTDNECCLIDLDFDDGNVLTKYMVNVEKGIQKLAIMTMCHTENNEALNIFIV